MNKLRLLAVDSGYGNTKYIFQNQNGRIEQHFPSIAVRMDDNKSIQTFGIDNRDVIVVDVNNQQFAVGRDADQLLPPYASRAANLDFINTDEYMALFRGVLQLCAADFVELAVVGLPVSLVNTQARHLQKILAGKHHLGEKIITISNVKVLPQPLGALIDLAFSTENVEKFKDRSTLIIDPGQFTLDWVVATGLKHHPMRSGSHAGGMHVVLEAMAKNISRTYKDVKHVNLLSLESGLRKGEFRIAGNTIDMIPHWEAAIPSIQDSLTALRNVIGDASDIDKILLVGGPASYLRPVIEHLFPSHAVTIANNPIMANVRGFYIAGSRYLAAKGED